MASVPWVRRWRGVFLAASLTWGLNGPVRAQDVPGAPDSLTAQIERLSVEVGRLSGLVDSLSAAVLSAPRSGPQDVTPADSGVVATATLVLEEAGTGVRRWGLRSLFAVLLLVLTGGVVRVASWVLDRLAERTVQRRLLYKRIEPIVRVTLWALAFVVILRGVFDVDATTLLTAGAAAGVAIGFAAQEILKNIFGGLVIIGDRPFQVGDKIAVGGTYGEVTGIGLRSTRLVTPDDSVVSVPNSQVVNGQVSNANSGALDCQVVTDLYLPGWVDLARAKEVAYRAAVTSRFVYLGKPVVVLVKDEFDRTFLTHIKVKAYVFDIRFEFPFMSDVTERARAGFRAAGLLPPWHGAFPEVHLDTERLPTEVLGA